MQNLDSIRQRVYQIDAIVKVLELASLQIERDGFVDTLRIVKAINWEVHDIVEKMDTSKPKKKKKKKSYKSLMKSIMKSSLTEEQMIERQGAKLDNILVDANFKKVDVI